MKRHLENSLIKIGSSLNEFDFLTHHAYLCTTLFTLKN